MPKLKNLNKNEIKELIEDLIFNSHKKYLEENIAKRMYSYLQDYKTTDQIAIIEAMIGSVKKEFGIFEKANLAARLSSHYLLDSTGILKELKEAASSSNKSSNLKIERSERAKNILNVIRKHAGANVTDATSENNAQDTQEDISALSKMNPQQYIKDNIQLMREYYTVLSCIQVYCTSLSDKLIIAKSYLSENEATECKEFLNHVQNYIVDKIQSNEYSESYDKLIIPVSDLVSFASYLVEIETRIDQRVSEKLQKEKQKMEPKEKKEQKLNKNYSYAYKLVAALSSFIESLLNLKRNFMSLFQGNKQSFDEVAPMPDPEVVKARKNLALFYNTTDKNLVKDLEDVKIKVSKIQQLPNRLN